MSIKSLKIVNFQSHEKTELALHPGVNVIVGESESGKTAIRRALYWLAFNRPGGESFRSWWSNEKSKTQVSILLDNDINIARYRSNSENAYSINDEVLKAVGQTVPQKVQDQLRISDINFLKQMDSPFLLSMSSGEVARYLNQIVHLDVIDVALSNISGILVREKNAIKEYDSQIAQLNTNLSEFTDLDDAENSIETIERMQERKEQLEKDASDLAKLIERILINVKEIDQIKNLSEAEIELHRLSKLNDDQFSLRTQVLQLSKLIDSIEETEKLQKSKQTFLAKLQKEFVIPAICPLCGQRRKQ